MKKILLAIAIAMCSVMSMTAQDTPTKMRSVYLEALGPSNLIGVSFDSRFKSIPRLGYRVGLGYTYGMTEHLIIGSTNHAITIPAEINYLIGKGKHNFEVGFGANYGYYTATLKTATEKLSHSRFGYFFYGNIGYRLVTSKNILFRAGVTPMFSFGGKNGVKHDPFLFPYVSIGYAF